MHHNYYIDSYTTLKCQGTDNLHNEKIRREGQMVNFLPSFCL